jgi:hypothetical protein
MKTFKYIVLIFVFALSVNGSCEHQKEGQRFIIQNNSEQEIIITYGSFPIPRKSCLTSGAQFEYEALIRDRMIRPHSAKNFERVGLGEFLISRPNDTLYIAVFYRTDVDVMSCEEFEQEFPIKKEWKVTLSDMQAADWTLVYPPTEAMQNVQMYPPYKE